VNYTNTLLDTKLDFVQGNFSRMTRSHSRIDPTPTRGYQDILLYLALEDVQNLAAVRTNLMSGASSVGDRLRFFVGMAHIKTLRSNRLLVTASQVEINADITSSYVYTTKTTTDFTFIRDVSVQLHQVKRPRVAGQNTSFAKFATITIIVPETLTSSDALNIIPPLSLHVGVGFTADTVAGKVYPCTQTYYGAYKTSLDSMLLSQDYCALQDPICKAQGPTPVGPGGSIQFTFPLEDSAWSETSLDADVSLRNSVFIDFMVSVVDRSGQRLVTNLKTSTVIQRTSVRSMCMDPELVKSSIEEILSVDIMLGLVGDMTQYNASLVQSLDVTKRGPENLRRDISSTASNVMTVLVKGDPYMFDEEYALDYTLAVEDIVTLHFLSTDKLNRVNTLMAAGRAYSQKKGLSTDVSTMQLMPSDELLNICPFQVIPGRFGCVARREVTKRRIDFQTNSIVNIAPNDNSDLFNVSTKAGEWTSQLLGQSEFARQLGFNHSTIMNQKHNLNARYRRGFMISPTTPWRKAEMVQADITTPLDLSQITITIILLSLDANINEPYKSTVPGGALHVGNYVPPPVAPSASRRLLTQGGSRQMGRMLLQFNSPSATESLSPELAMSNLPETTPLPSKNTAPSTTREITSVNDNANVVKAVCANTPSTHKCAMVRLTKSVTTAEFCQNEEDIIAQLQPEMNDVIHFASDDALEAIHITSVSQQHRESICNSVSNRRLLATTQQDLVFTLVLEVRAMVSQFAINPTTLNSNQITAITGLTNDTFWRLCNGMVTNDCVKLIAKEYNTTRDIVLDFSLDNADPVNRPLNISQIKSILRQTYVNSTYVIISPPIYDQLSNQTRFEVRISVPFLQEYPEMYETAVKHAFVAIGLRPEDALQSKIVLKMAPAQVNSTVVDQFRKTAAMSYGVNMEKVEVNVLPDEFTGETVLSLTVRTLVDTSDVSFTVEITMTFPLFPSEFISQQPAYVASVANVAMVSFNKVAVKSIVDTTTVQRRLLASQIDVTFLVTVSSLAAASSIRERLSLANLNVDSAASGLSISSRATEAVVASLVSRAAQERATSRVQNLNTALIALDLMTPLKQIIYLEAAITIDGEMHKQNNDTVVLLYLLCIFLIALMILLLLWARRNFAAAKDPNRNISYDAMQADNNAVQQGAVYPTLHPFSHAYSSHPIYGNHH